MLWCRGWDRTIQTLTGDPTARIRADFDGDICSNYHPVNLQRYRTRERRARRTCIYLPVSYTPAVTLGRTSLRSCCPAFLSKKLTMAESLRKACRELKICNTCSAKAMRWKSWIVGILKFSDTKIQCAMQGNVAALSIQGWCIWSRQRASKPKLTIIVQLVRRRKPFNRYGGSRWKRRDQERQRGI